MSWFVVNTKALYNQLPILSNLSKRKSCWISWFKNKWTHFRNKRLIVLQNSSEYFTCYSPRKTEKTEEKKSEVYLLRALKIGKEKKKKITLGTRALAKAAQRNIWGLDTRATWRPLAIDRQVYETRGGNLRGRTRRN